jgi:hypothetical protein
MLFWKGCSLWFAAKDNKKIWFLVLLVVNLFGILDIIYIFHISKRTWSDVTALFGERHHHKAKDTTEEEPEAPHTETE